MQLQYASETPERNKYLETCVSIPFLWACLLDFSFLLGFFFFSFFLFFFFFFYITTLLVKIQKTITNGFR